MKVKVPAAPAAFAATLLATAALSGCGNAQFAGKTTDSTGATADGSSSSNGAGSASGSVNAASLPRTAVASGTVGAGNATGSVVTSGGTASGTASTSGGIDVPGAAPSDVPLLAKCLSEWPNNPFGSGPIQNYKVIYASVSVLGFGNAIDDTEKTTSPELILVDAGVNVLGSPTYSLLNPNGYYCLKVNVNVLTQLTVNLDCAAHLADSRVDVSVLSNTGSTTSEVGVNVLSSVQVDNIRPQGETCIR